MAGGEQRHARRPRLRRLPVLLVVLVLASSLASYQFDLGPRWLGWDYPSPIEEPAAVRPPPGLDLPEPEPADAVAVPLADGDDAEVDPAEVRRAVRPYASRKVLGPHASIVVTDYDDGTPVFEAGTGPVIPASTMKLLTTTAALEALGRDHTFRTTVRTVPNRRRIVLVGGGDPLLSSHPVTDEIYPPRANIATLAEATAKALSAKGRIRVRLAYDDSLFAGPAINPAWPASYVPDGVVTPISALWVDEGRTPDGLRAADPALLAAQTFRAALVDAGIEVVGRLIERTAKEESVEVAAVESAPLGEIVQRVLDVSDNEGAEVLFRHVALAEGLPGSFAGGATAVADVLERLGVDLTGAEIYDGSGLSRENLLAPQTLLDVLAVAGSEDHPGLRPVVTGLPVAGFTGSLTYRFDAGDEAGPGRVRAKTGTLTGVHGLAGLTTDLDGNVLAFVAIADRVKVSNTLAARATIDQLAAALAGCPCSAAP